MTVHAACNAGTKLPPVVLNPVAFISVSNAISFIAYIHLLTIAFPDTFFPHALILVASGVIMSAPSLQCRRKSLQVQQT